MLILNFFHLLNEFEEWEGMENRTTEHFSWSSLGCGHMGFYWHVIQQTRNILVNIFHVAVPCAVCRSPVKVGVWVVGVQSTSQWVVLSLLAGKLQPVSGCCWCWGPSQSPLQPNQHHAKQSQGSFRISHSRFSSYCLYRSTTYQAQWYSLGFSSSFKRRLNRSITKNKRTMSDLTPWRWVLHSNNLRCHCGILIMLARNILKAVHQLRFDCNSCWGCIVFSRS